MLQVYLMRTVQSLNAETPHPVVGLISEWLDEEAQVEYRSEQSDLGGTMRLGSQLCHLVKGTKACDVYGSETINERHRHRFEVNNNYREQLSKSWFSVLRFIRQIKV